MTKESPMKRIIRWIKGDASAETEATRQENYAIAARIQKKRKDKRGAKVGAAVATLVLCAVLPGCANFPRLKLELGAFGFTAAVDTRTLTDTVGDAFVSVSDLVLPHAPEALPAPVAAPAPAVEPAK